MRRLIVLEHITLDGVIQAPGGPREDPSGGFLYGGWIGAYDDAVVGEALRNRMSEPFDLLLGRKTFDIWAPYWPNHADVWPGVMTAVKYVASNTLRSHDWQPSIFLGGDIVEKVAHIKREPGPDLNVWGSGNLLQTLMKHDLVDELWLMTYPITLGVGKRLFAEGTVPTAYNVVECIAGPSGIVATSYARAGAITSGC